MHTPKAVHSLPNYPYKHIEWTIPANHWNLVPMKPLNLFCISSILQIFAFRGTASINKSKKEK